MIGTERHENKVRPKRLIIMSGDVVPETENIDLRYSDLLALSLPTMVILDKKNIKYKIFVLSNEFLPKPFTSKNINKL